MELANPWGEDAYQAMQVRQVRLREGIVAADEEVQERPKRVKARVDRLSTGMVWCIPGCFNGLLLNRDLLLSTVRV